ncbi:hypothetical protein C8R46DRAFT_238423 [Mycena filopes]|nr:hypothetical protein C8R46DRAFT_238423 [Mycena filopes]
MHTYQTRRLIQNPGRESRQKREGTHLRPKYGMGGGGREEGECGAKPPTLLHVPHHHRNSCPAPHRTQCLSAAPPLLLLTSRTLNPSGRHTVVTSGQSSRPDSPRPQRAPHRTPLASNSNTRLGSECTQLHTLETRLSRLENDMADIQYALARGLAGLYHTPVDTSAQTPSCPTRW